MLNFIILGQITRA